MAKNPCYNLLKMTAAFATTALILALATVQSDPDEGVRFAHNDGKFQLLLPKGHHLRESEDDVRYRYERLLGDADWEWLRLRLTVGEERLAQEPLPDNPRLIPSLSRLPANAKFEMAPVSWKGVDIPAASYTFIDEEDNLELFGYSMVIPLTPKALLVDVLAAKVYEFEVRQELTSILASVEGNTNWLTPDEQKKVGYLIWPGLAAIVLAAAYLPVWLIFFRGFPWRAHGFRVGWLLATGILFFSGFMLSLTFGDLLEKGEITAPILSWAVVALPGMLCYVGLAFRRIVLYIDG